MVSLSSSRLFVSCAALQEAFDVLYRKLNGAIMETDSI